MTTEIRPPAAHQKPSGGMYLSVEQSNLIHNTWTFVELDAISAGFTDGIEDVVNHKLTPGAAGFYIVIAQVCLLNLIADKNYRVTIRISDATSVADSYAHASTEEYLTIACAALLYLSATDYVQMGVVSMAGVNTVDVLGNPRYTFLSVQRVR